MNTYAIGSVTGHYQPLLKLLAHIGFDPENDRLWFAGNLVNTGPQSLDVLRFVKGLGNKAVTVLGVQELHLLALAEGYAQPKPGDTLDDILNAPDRDELLKWLRRRALIHHDAKLNFTLAHAGIYPEWTFSQALTFAYEVESVFSQNNHAAFFAHRGQEQSRWHAKLRGWKRLNFIANAYTLMKYCNREGKLDFQADDTPSVQTDGLMPWYRLPERPTANLNIVFADTADFQDLPCPGIYPLPAQGRLSALKLSVATPEWFSVVY